VRTVGPADDVAVFAMTATGSFLELGRPLPDGSRHYLYHASARPDAVREEGTLTLTEPLLLGNRVWLGTRRTMELLILAAGPELPPYDETVPGTQLHGPTEDVPELPVSDALRVGMARFRVMVDTAENAVIPLRPSFPSARRRAGGRFSSARCAARGCPVGGRTTTGSGSRYEVEQLAPPDLVRYASDAQTQSARRGHRRAGPSPTRRWSSSTRLDRPCSVAFVFRIARIERRER
jgi:hypothetical protein